ncbi:hypothetical protein ES703_113586 [subsurface metagenome]
MSMLLAGCAVGVFHYRIRPGKTFFHVPFAKLPMRDHIIVAMNFRGIRLHRLQRIEYRGQVLIVRLDQLEGLAGDVQTLRGHQGDRFSVIAHPLFNQDLVPGLQETHLCCLPHYIFYRLIKGNILSGQHTDHSRERFSFG